VFGSVTDYEILLMLDPELPKEGKTEIVTRAREAIEKDRRPCRSRRGPGAGAPARPTKIDPQERGRSTTC